MFINDSKPFLAFTWFFGDEGLDLLGSASTIWDMLHTLGVDQSSIENKIFAKGENLILLLLSIPRAEEKDVGGNKVPDEARIEKRSEGAPFPDEKRIETSPAAEAEPEVCAEPHEVSKPICAFPATWGAIETVVNVHYPDVAAAIIRHLPLFKQGLVFCMY